MQAPFGRRPPGPAVPGHVCLGEPFHTASGAGFGKKFTLPARAQLTNRTELLRRPSQERVTATKNRQVVPQVRSDLCRWMSVFNFRCRVGGEETRSSSVGEGRFRPVCHPDPALGQEQSSERRLGQRSRGPRLSQLMEQHLKNPRDADNATCRASTCPDPGQWAQQRTGQPPTKGGAATRDLGSTRFLPSFRV